MSTVSFATHEVEKAVTTFKSKCAENHGYKSENISTGFSVEPTRAQKINTKVQEKNDFLAKINILPVRDLVGENILIGVAGPSSSRTNTSAGNKREPKVYPQLEGFTYELHKTNTDVLFTYAQIDTWRKFPDFVERMTNSSLHRIGLDRVMCGWYGESAAKDTDISTHPQLQDLNKGWMQYMRDKLPANILSEGKTAGELRIGKSGDYETLDQAVADLLTTIEDAGLDTTDLVVLVGRDLMQQERERVYNNALTPEQKQVHENARVTFGGVPVEKAPSLPPRFLAVTPLSNLSIYHQEDSWRRKVDDQPEYDRMVDYTSRNEGYVVEDPRLFVAVEFKNVKLPAAGDTWA
ncbi:phage major capsid protein, P2 family [Sansalvadorimonas verongulae]|uniref:phage major capsid protein, P2 family n=1 Tax=Sansalvadorimonas verongulae TaxID=2172824 RepID=UPI0012BBB157|nr:phage major capsid protein, P2 family [Sansalvadorimonas verongulae]MTI12261.1 phage major capsid protein, P2 family [Sansalvadorimonas verongulae]